MIYKCVPPSSTSPPRAGQRFQTPSTQGSDPAALPQGEMFLQEHQELSAGQRTFLRRSDSSGCRKGGQRREDVTAVELLGSRTKALSDAELYQETAQAPPFSISWSAINGIFFIQAVLMKRKGKGMPLH